MASVWCVTGVFYNTGDTGVIDTGNKCRTEEPLTEVTAL